MIRFLFGLADKAISFVEFCIIVDAILSWVVNPYNKYRKILGAIVNPILDPIRKKTSQYIRIGFIDFSPVIAIILLEVLKWLLRILLMILI